MIGVYKIISNIEVTLQLSTAQKSLLSRMTYNLMIANITVAKLRQLAKLDPFFLLPTQLCGLSYTKLTPDPALPQ